MIELQEWIVFFDSGRGRSPQGEVKTTKGASEQIALNKAWKKYVRGGVLCHSMEVIKKEYFYK